MVIPFGRRLSRVTTAISSGGVRAYRRQNVLLEDGGQIGQQFKARHCGASGAGES